MPLLATSVAIPAGPAERAATRYTVATLVPALGSCHITTYSTASHGYGQVGWREDGRTRMTTTQRAAWTHFEGPILDGLTVDHRCHVRTCVRREHLRLLPNPENAKDNGQVRVNGECGEVCSCGEVKVKGTTPRSKPYCRSCQNRRRRDRRARGSRN